MQDLGVCDEARCFDDVIIPDVDFTFRNFEELYGNEHEPNRAVIDDKDMDCSDRGYARIFEVCNLKQLLQFYRLAKFKD